MVAETECAGKKNSSTIELNVLELCNDANDDSMHWTQQSHSLFVTNLRKNLQLWKSAQPVRHIHEIGASTIALNRMVLLRSWVSLDIQQRLVHESQSSAHLFHRPSTAGGGKYHIYSVCLVSLSYLVGCIYMCIPSDCHFAETWKHAQICYLIFLCCGFQSLTLTISLMGRICSLIFMSKLAWSLMSSSIPLYLNALNDAFCNTNCLMFGLGFSLVTCRCLGAVSGIQKHDNMLHMREASHFQGGCLI